MINFSFKNYKFLKEKFFNSLFFDKLWLIQKIRKKFVLSYLNSNNSIKKFILFHINWYIDYYAIYIYIYRKKNKINIFLITDYLLFNKRKKSCTLNLYLLLQWEIKVQF